MNAVSPLILGDSLANLVTSLGTAKAKSEGGFFSQGYRIAPSECLAIYRTSWLGQKVVDIPAQDCTRLWRKWNAASTATVEAIEAEEKRLRLRASVTRALKWAARDGGAALVIGTRQQPQEPIDLSRIGRQGITFIHCVSRYQLSVGEPDRDPESPGFGGPRMWFMSMPDGATLPLHPSRVIVFAGNDPPTPWLEVEPWGDSVYEAMREPIRDATAGFQGLAALMQEAKVDVVQVPGLTANVGNDGYRDAIVKRFGLALMAKSISNSLLLDSNEKWEQKTLSFAGWPEAIDRLLLAVAGAANMPITRLIGRSPSGLNATGEADERNWYDTVREKQDNEIRPALDLLDQALIRSATGRQMPRGVWYEWLPLREQNPVEKADIGVKAADAIKKITETGLYRGPALARAARLHMEEVGFLAALAAEGEDAIAPEPEELPAESQLAAGSGAGNATPPSATRRSRSRGRAQSSSEE